MKAQAFAINSLTGEIVEFPAGGYAEIVESWRIVNAYLKTYTELKNQLKELVPLHVNDKGISEPLNGYMFRVINTQRLNYDKSVMRKIFDEDTLDLLLKPDKTKVDTYLREHLDEVGQGSTELRNSMVADSKPYQAIKLEKLGRIYDNNYL